MLIYRRLKAKHTIRRLIKATTITSTLNKALQELRAGHDKGLFDQPTLSKLIKAVCSKYELPRYADQWRTFFRAMPESIQWDCFDKGDKLAIVELCGSVPGDGTILYDNILLGITLAKKLGEDGWVRRLHEQAGDTAAIANDHDRAESHYRASESTEKLGSSLEAQGRFWEALDAASASPTLIEKCARDVDADMANSDYLSALKRLDLLRAKVGSAPDRNDLLQTGRQLDERRETLLDGARAYFPSKLESSSANDSNDVRSEWSRFEETAGDLRLAAELSKKAGNPRRAEDLFKKAGLYGSAMEVAHPASSAAEIAKLQEESGDPVGAAEAYEMAEQWKEAIRCYVLGDRPGRAAELMRSTMTEVELLNDAEYVGFMRGSGKHREIVDLVVRHAECITPDAPAVRFLEEELRKDHVDREILQVASDAIDAIYGRRRKEFESCLMGWIKSACKEVDERYSKSWGLDLGTTNSAALIYNKETRIPESALWRNKADFPSTLAVDTKGLEVVGTTQEELLTDNFQGSISSSKRRMGTSHSFTIGNRSYLPEDVAARIIYHGRRVVERHLGQKVAELVRERASEEFGRYPAAWLDQKFGDDYRPIERGTAVVTIPAFFHLNQKSATRAACEIAGTIAQRMLHEPTAALFGMNVEGVAVVVDVGAGTTDLSVVECAIEDSGKQFEVKYTFGNNALGGNDFDDAIYEHLVKRLKIEHSIVVRPNSGEADRIQIASERLKVELSHQEKSKYTMYGLTSAGGLVIEMSRDEMLRALKEPLQRLKDVLQDFKKKMEKRLEHEERPKYLALVGGSTLAPWVRGIVEGTLGLKSVSYGRANAKTAVAHGAALQAAVLAGDIRDNLLLDIVPLSLGIAAVSDGSDKEKFVEVIEEGTTIPIKKEQSVLYAS